MNGCENVIFAGCAINSFWPIDVLIDSLIYVCVFLN